MIGETVDHYKITDKIGQGGMGEVFLAEDTKLKRKVALKFLPENLSAVPEARQRFMREAQAVASLNHANILTIHEVAEHEGRPFFAMEYIDGQPLSEYCEMDRTLDELVTVAIQIVKGLQKAHQSGVIHRDLKPNNILIDNDGNVKIVDFGLAQVRGTAKLTQNGSAVGTASYMSPEQAQGRDIDHRSDLFSFGSVLFEMVTGHPAFPGDHEAAIVYSIVNENPQPLGRSGGEVSDQLKRIVSKCLAKSPEQRYQSADDLLVDLRTCSQSGLQTGIAPVSTAQKRKMIAVLPFENLGPAEDEYFADGITEEITGRLATVAELGVISRTSAMHYKSTNRPMREIGHELGADCILEGTVRWARSKHGPSRVRITPQLIQVSDDTHLWAGQYDRVLEDIFDVQSDIAEQVIAQLNVTLLDHERSAVKAKPTRNMEAYQAYLRGLEHLLHPDPEKGKLTIAVKMFERAIELDAQFVQAYACLSMTHTRMYHHGQDRTKERLTDAEEAVTQAERVNPDLAETHYARGMIHYCGYHRYDDALTELQLARDLMPNNAQILTYISAVHRRRGEFDDSLKHSLKACDLSPRDPVLHFDTGSTYNLMRRYADANRLIERSITLAPDQIFGYLFKVVNEWSWHGDLRRARDIFNHVPTNAFEFWPSLWVEQLILERDYDGALKHLANLSVNFLSDQTDHYAKSQIEAMLWQFKGEEKRAHTLLQHAQQLLSVVKERDPDDSRVRSALGIVYAGLRQREKAIEEGRAGMQLMPVSDDAVTGPVRVFDMAHILTLVGDHDRAIDLLAQILELPTHMSSRLFQLDPRLDPLRDQERFQQLLAKPDVVF